MALTQTDKQLLQGCLGTPETANRVIALLEQAGTGNVTGPGSSTNNAVVLFDGTTGGLIKNSGILDDGAGNVFVPQSLLTSVLQAGVVSLSDSPTLNTDEVFIQGNINDGFNVYIDPSNIGLVLNIEPTTGTTNLLGYSGSADKTRLRLIPDTDADIVRLDFANNLIGPTYIFSLAADFAAGNESFAVDVQGAHVFTFSLTDAIFHNSIVLRPDSDGNSDLGTPSERWGSLYCSGSVSMGGGLVIETAGANKRMGVATLVAGSVVVPNTTITANTRIFLTKQDSGTLVATGALHVSARTVGADFTISSDNALDTSDVAWLLVEANV